MSTYHLKIAAVAIAGLCLVQEGQAGGFVPSIRISDDIRRIAIALRENPDVLTGFIHTKAFQSADVKTVLRAALDAKNAKEAGLHLMDLSSPALQRLTKAYQDKWLSSVAHRDEMAEVIMTTGNEYGTKLRLANEIDVIAGRDRGILAHNITHPMISGGQTDLLRDRLRFLSASDPVERAILEACDRFVFGRSSMGLQDYAERYERNWDELPGSLGVRVVSLYSWLVSARRMLLDARVIRYTSRTEGTLAAIQSKEPRIFPYEIGQIILVLKFVKSKLELPELGSAVAARIEYLERTSSAASEAGDAASMLTRAKDEPSPYPLMIQELHDQLMSVVGDLG